MDFKKSNYCFIGLKKKNQNNISNLYDSINLHNYSKKDLLLKTNKSLSINKVQLTQNNSSNMKSIKNYKSFIPIERKSTNKAEFDIQAYNYLNNSKSNIKNEKKSNKEKEDKEDTKKSLIYNKIKKLIDEPSSFVYLMYNQMQRLKLKKKENVKNISLKNRIREYKKNILKLGKSAQYQIFNLKKQVAIGAEDTIKGKIISTNTFFDLAFG